MATYSVLRIAMRLGCAAALLAAPAMSEAQNASRSVRPVPQPAAPALTPGAPGPGAPRPAGLPSPIPNPEGLPSRFPAGLPPPSAPTDPPPVDTGIAPPTNVSGAAGYGGVAMPRQPAGAPGPYTALQIAQSFLAADANRDGELSRAEAQRLPIMPYSIEEMDRNRDGILTRFEYEDAMR